MKNAMSEARNILCIIQARMNSLRLPGKVLMDLSGVPMLAHVAQRVRSAANINRVVIATSDNPADDAIADFCNKENIDCFRGSEESVLSRYYEAAQQWGGEIIVRVTADCPLIDPQLVEAMINFYLANDFDFVTNVGLEKALRTYPRGMDTEIFNMALLKEAYKQANEPYQFEHVTPYMYEHSQSIHYYKNSEDNSQIRLTVDTLEDYQLIKRIYQEFYHGKYDFSIDEVIMFLKENNDLLAMNKHVTQKAIKGN